MDAIAQFTYEKGISVINRMLQKKYGQTIDFSIEPNKRYYEKKVCWIDTSFNHYLYRQRSLKSLSISIKMTDKQLRWLRKVLTKRRTTSLHILKNQALFLLYDKNYDLKFFHCMIKKIIPAQVF